MSDFHDPIRQVDLLRQALSVPKRPVSFFIGAGCPLSICDKKGTPIIPDVKGMTKIISEDICKGDNAKPFKKLHKQLSEKEEPTVEDYLGHLRMIQEVVKQSPIDGFPSADVLSLEASICDMIVDLASAKLKDNGTPYHHLATWIRGVTRAIPVELFTTNYDLLMEQALEELRVPYFDGFIGSYQAFFDPDSMESEEASLPARWARLWKLHGSVNWRTTKREAPYEVIRTGERVKECHLIHPSHLKYDESRQMPFLAMMDRLKSFLRKPTSVLITSGYSFSDRHINALIRQALAANQDAMTFGLLYRPIKEYPNAIILAKKTPNLTLLAHDGAVIGTRQLTWKSLLENTDLPTGILFDKEKKATSVTLGDFRVLGQFLQELIGQHPADAQSPTESLSV